MELRISEGVGKMIENFGFGGEGWVGRLVERAGKKVLESQFSPREAMEEIWRIICGWVWSAAFEGGEVLVGGMQLRMFLRAGQPQLGEFLVSRAWIECLPGTLAIKAPRTSLKSYCCSCETRAWSLVGP